MPQLTECILINSPAQHTLTIRTTTSVEKLPELIGESYAKIGLYLAELGEFPADVPFVAYHNLDMQNLDVEIGFSVARKLAAQDDIKPGKIAASPMVFAMHQGPYREMKPTYDKMAQWIADNGYQPLGSAYEYYFNGPGTPEPQLLTTIVMPLK